MSVSAYFHHECSRARSRVWPESPRLPCLEAPPSCLPVRLPGGKGLCLLALAHLARLLFLAPTGTCCPHHMVPPDGVLANWSGLPLRLKVGCVFPCPGFLIAPVKLHTEGSVLSRSLDYKS